jgi:broad specificity phosphatase PhoE
MTRLLLIRHGRTAWNEAGRLQGRADVPLSPAGRAEVATWSLPPGWQQARWLTSPLARARETAALLTTDPVTVEPRLIEMDWGAWEGRCLVDLRREAPEAMAKNEARGLDFRPHGGESPREVAARLAPLIEELARQPTPAVAVTHKGVMRAALALATGWDMRTKPPHRLRHDAALAFTCHADGRIQLEPPPPALEPSRDPRI